ncbi:hypothetical protein [Frigoribacterium sp. UYMn621]|uniref:hypothetical protein n=1 Tax=Frigoribacterium sp. UYMn621 TaxID=3156343 RepID=UPI0033922039
MSDYDDNHDHALPHEHHRLGVKQIPTHLLEIVEFEPDEIDNFPVFRMFFNGDTLLELAEAYRLLGSFLDDKYAGTEPTA